MNDKHAIQLQNYKTGGCCDLDTLEPTLALIGSRCINGATWLCDYKAHRSVLLDGKRRTVSWLLNLEPMRKPSPWLSMCALEITKAYKES